MSLGVQHLVFPKLPTALANDAHIELPGYDITFIYIDQVHIISIKLDVSKFEDALSRVLQLYPHAAGQFRCTDKHWSIELTNTAVPVAIDYRLDTNSNSLLDGDWVVQDINNLSLLLNQHPIGVNVVNSCNPLLRFKLTFLDHETCIGVSWSHAIGDAIMMSRFMHMLSQFYQGLLPEFPVPTFKKHHFPTLSPSICTELSSHMPLHQFGHFDEVAFIESCKDLEEVRWCFDDEDLDELRSALSSTRKSHVYLSKQDCLAAYLAAILNHNENPVRVVRNVSSFRHINAPFVSENVASNLILIVSANVPKDMAGIAIAIRNALVQSRELRVLELLGSWCSEHMLKAANAGNFIPFLFGSDELFVNSLVVIDWCSINFGCSLAGGARFHTHGVGRLLVRCFRSNPVKGEDGVWHARRSIDISLGVSAEVKPRIMETFARGIQYMLSREEEQTQW